jgi:Cathepsin propeptide inhibitor domain (I29)
MKSAVVASLTLTGASGMLSTPSFAEFQNKHAKGYKTKEELVLRRGIYAANLQKIAEHNKRFETGDVTYTQKVNKFADLTPEEFKSRYASGFRYRFVTPSR